jgi:hypothetical protein
MPVDRWKRDIIGFSTLLASKVFDTNYFDASITDFLSLFQSIKVFFLRCYERI